MNCVSMVCVQVFYTSLMMLITLTVFAYILGEISNAIMEADEELVKQRSQVQQSP